VFDLLAGQLGEHREREHAARLLFGAGEVALAVAERGVGWLQVDGHGVMYACLHARVVQLPLQFVARVRLDDEEMVDVARVKALARERERARRVERCEQFAVVRGMCAALVVPVVEVFEFHREHRALDAFEAEVVADKFVMVLALGAVVAEHADAARYLQVVRQNSAALAVCAEVLAGVEAEAARARERADGTVAVERAVRLRGVLDDEEIATRRDFKDGVEVCRLAVEVYGDDCARASGDGRLDFVRVNRV